MRILQILLVTFVFNASVFAELANLPAKASTDRSETRHLVLDNGLRVILLSDPDLNKSSASLVAGVGSYNDPEDRAGLAHFLEHMLFLGSKKFPGDTDYSRYLKSNGGYSNAYTSGDHTNYHFEISHQAFDGALDRFSQFFVAPLFNPDFTAREMNAVDSEFEKNLQSDLWRTQEIWRTMVREDHPERHFSIGNLKTLEGITRDEFLGFYKQYYSANQMALAMTSNHSLDKMEGWAKVYFNAIENRQLKAIDYSDQLIDPTLAPGLTLIEPVQDLRKLSLIFPVKGALGLYRSKPGELIGFLLGYEGEGSLLSHLKAEGLASSLGGDFYHASKDYSLAFVEVELTAKGSEQWREVMNSTFAYINLLRDSDYPDYLFQERATMARLNELYANKGEGADRALSLANNALNYPLEDAARADYLWDEASPEDYFELLSLMRPDNMVAMLEMKGVPTNLSEEHFGAQYSLQPFTAEELKQFNNPEPVAAVTLPAPNRFIPNTVELLATAPSQVISEPGLSLFYGQDTEFERPRVSYQIRIRQEKAQAEVSAAVKRDFYVTLLSEVINEQAYAASTAGLRVAVTDGSKGISLSVSGYSQSANALLESVLKQMRQPDFDETRFAAIKDRKVRALQNAVFTDAWQQARELERKLFWKHYATPEEQLAVAKDLTADSIKRYAKTLFKRGNVEMMAYGNVSQGEAEALARGVVKTLKLKPLDAHKVFERKTLKLNAGEPVVSTNILKVNNSAFRQGILLGEANAKNRAAAHMVSTFFADLYYGEMRTRQQLGYIVGGYHSESEGKLHARFIIQSADYSADELMERSNTFLATLPAAFDAADDTRIDTIRAAVRAELEQKDKSIAERGARFFNLAFERDGNWGRAQETLAALDALSREDVRAMLEKIANNSAAGSFAVLSMAEQHADSAAKVKPSFSDVNAWKRKQKYE
jgi:insulysin